MIVEPSVILLVSAFLVLWLGISFIGAGVFALVSKIYELVQEL